jgi:hypothetical protein
MKISELFEAVELKPDDFKIETIADNQYKVSTAATSGPAVQAIKSMYMAMRGKPNTFIKITSKSGGQIDYSNFKANGFLVTAKTEDAVKQVVDKITGKANRDSIAADRYKAKEPERKKLASARSAAEQKERKAAMEVKYGKGTYDRVKTRQVGGDDGYQYNVFVDGRSVMNGLTRSSADYEADKQRDRLAKENKLGKYSK